MKDRHDLMPILRLAYSTQFLIALMAVFVLWSQVGGQSHLDLLPWSVKLVLGLAAAYGVVRATAASVSGDRAWNGQAVRWLGFTLAVLAACGYATYYAHMNLEETDDADQQQDTTISRMQLGLRPCDAVLLRGPLPHGRGSDQSTVERAFRLPCRYSYRHASKNVGKDADAAACKATLRYNSVRLESARRLARSAPTSATTIRSPSRRKFFRISFHCAAVWVLCSAH